MTCPVCSSVMKPCFTAKVLNKYLAQYEVCGFCGFLRAYEPHWMEEAYTSAITSADTGLVMRNISIACKLSGVLYWVVGGKKNTECYLDAAGGYGMLTRLMRDFGFNFYWNDKYCDNILSRGFEYNEKIGSCFAVTAIEVMEHLTNPAQFLEETMSLSGAETFVFSTELYKGNPPQPDAWWYYAFPTGQHIGFFQRQTLEILGARLGLKLTSANGIHIFSKKALNEKLLNVVTGRWVSRFSPWWIRHRFGSRTMDDHLSIIQKIS